MKSAFTPISFESIQEECNLKLKSLRDTAMGIANLQNSLKRLEQTTDNLFNALYNIIHYK